MKPPLPSRADFDLSLRRVHQGDFQAKVLDYLTYLHPAAQKVELKHGDGGMDIIQINDGRVYACYAPAHMGEWEESKVIAKIRADLELVKQTLGTALKEWVFVHNFPSSALTKKIAAFMIEHRQAHPGISFMDAWGIDQLWENIVSPTPKQRREAYLRSLLTAFHSYQELALNDHAAPDKKSPDIWDIFVHPACSTNYLTPEAVDLSQRAVPPISLGSDLLPILGSDTARRHVLLADPGMGKSTLIQSLIAHLASGRPLSGAPALTGLLPVPIILRDVVPLLPQATPESWTWDMLLTVLIDKYHREERSPPLCQAYHGHEQEFRDLVQQSDQVFFLIDGLDEIGDRAKRSHLVRTIQEGIRTADRRARWLITSRIIGYEESPIDIIYAVLPKVESEALSEPERTRQLRWRFKKARANLREEWGDLAIVDSDGAEMRSTVVHEDDLEHAPELAGLWLSADSQFLSVPTINIAQRLYLAPFDDQRQDAFTQRWFHHRATIDYSADLMREVRSHGHDGVRTIARVPNLLCMMNMLKRSGRPLPHGRYALYDEIVKTYNGGLDATYFQNKLHDHHCPIASPERRFLLALLGAHMQRTRTLGTDETENGEPRTENDTILITKPELHELLVPTIQTMQRSGKVKDQRSASDLLNELLHHIASRSGLLIPRSADAEGQAVYGFTHLSFLEFFAAEWLGKEFDRQRNRLARKAEAAAEDLPLTEADLEREFPAHGPIQHQRADCPQLAATPAWHEPLIFLVEARPSDLSTLLRWLFPQLHSKEAYTVPEDRNKAVPLMPLDAVALVAKLAQDQELAITPTTRQHWWRTLWAAHLQWPCKPWDPAEPNRWHIGALAAAGIDAIDATDDTLSLTVTQYLALGSVTLATGDFVVLLILVPVSRRFLQPRSVRWLRPVSTLSMHRTM